MMRATAILDAITGPFVAGSLFDLRRRQREREDRKIRTPTKPIDRSPFRASVARIQRDCRP